MFDEILNAYCQKEHLRHLGAAGLKGTPVAVRASWHRLRRADGITPAPTTVEGTWPQGLRYDPWHPIAGGYMSGGCFPTTDDGFVVTGAPNGGTEFWSAILWRVE